MFGPPSVGRERAMPGSRDARDLSFGRGNARFD
jgi:hypothetical protein